MTGTIKISKIPWWRTSFGEEEVSQIRAAILNEHVSQGPVTAEFEARFAEALEVPYAVATTSGSTALLLALMALGIGRDDEVIVPNRTFIATAHAALLLGAKAVPVDVLPDTPTMDVSQIRQKITSRTRAIMPVHLNGRAVEMEQVNEVAEEYGLGVVEDACQALFSRSTAGYLGTQSDMGCFSLGATKLISTGQGGIVVTRSPKMYEQLKLIRNHGVADTFRASYEQMGFNFKFTDILASIGLVQLGRAPQRIEHTTAVYSKYAAAMGEYGLPFLQLIPVKVAQGEVPLYVEVLCTKRQELRDFLDPQGISTRPFLPDIDLSPHLNSDGEYPNSRVFSERGLFLPCGPEQPLENIDRVLEVLRVYSQ